MQATIEKYTYWQFIAALVTLPLLFIYLPHRLFPQTAQSNTGKFLLLSIAASIVVLYFILKTALSPKKILTLQIDKGEFALTEGYKTIISEFESRIQLVLAKYKASTTNHTPYLLLKFMNQNNKQVLKIKVSGSVRLNKGFPDTLAELDTADMWGYYETNKTEALKILKYYGSERLVTFQ